MSAGPATLLNIQRGELTVEGWTQVHTYQVFTTDGTDGPDVVLEASGLPSFNSALTYDPLSRVMRITPIKQRDATIHWEVEVEYGKERGSQEDTQHPPTNRRTVRSFSIRWVEKALMEDEEGNPILTSAKTPFNPPITISIPHPVIRFQRWEDPGSLTTALVRQYAGKVNSTDVGAYVAGEVLCSNIEGTEQWEQDENGDLLLYCLITYEFEACVGVFDMFRPQRVLDCDYWFLDPTQDGKRVPIFVDKNGNYHGNPDDPLGATPAPTPVPLAASPAGDVLQPAELPDAAHYLEWNVLGEVDFGPLNLPFD